MKKYVVEPGDTLYQISQKTGVRVPLLLASNPQLQNPNELMPGMHMVIPELGKPAKTSQAKSKVRKQSSSYQGPSYFGFVWPHQVQSTDTWEALTKKYGVSLEQLQHVNPHVGPDQMPPEGDMLYVPTSTLPMMMEQGGAGSFAGGAAMGQTPDQTSYGPHTHAPFRYEAGTVQNGQPEGWYVDGDESSSFFASSSLVEMTPPDVRADVRGQTQETAAEDDEGWSGALTVQLDGDA